MKLRVMRLRAKREAASAAPKKQARKKTVTAGSVTYFWFHGSVSNSGIVDARGASGIQLVTWGIYRTVINKSLSREETMGLNDFTVYDFICRSAKIYADNESIVDNHIRLTHRQFKEKCDQAAAGLIEAGVTAGDRLAVIAHNCAQ